MAEITIMGSFEGPGEKRTAEHLAAVLPDHWRIFCNRKLPTNSNDDVDIIVVGEHAVFIVEEKSWGPKVVIGNHLWSVAKPWGQIDDRPNAFNSVSTKAKKAITWLKNSVPALQSSKKHLTIPIVIFSHPDIEILEKPGYKIPDNIFTLDESKEFFEHLDANNSAGNLSENRSKVIATVLDLESADQELSKIGNYKVLHELNSRKGVRVFEAEHNFTGETSFLKCYSNLYWSQAGDGAEALITREIQAMIRLEQANRSWFHRDPFHFEAKDWTVFPIVKPNGVVSLQELIDDPLRSFFKNKSLEIARDAFEALREVHAEKIAHKVLTPSRIWIGKGLRVRFSDFFLAHIDGDSSVVAIEEDSSSVAFRDPQAAVSLAFADSTSDVYALSFSLASWLTGIDISDKAAMLDALLAKDAPPLFQVLTNGLSDDRDIRWTASQLAEAIASILEPTPAYATPVGETVFEVGRTVSGRFEILEKLGRGGVATTWKVRDRYAEGSIKVLKQLHDESSYELAVAEFSNANKLHHPGCSKTKEVQEKPAPGFLISEYIPGVTLLEKAKEAGFGVSEARAIARQCLAILGYIHQENFVHGDLSPKNIIVGDDGKVTLIDFGFLAAIGNIQQAGTIATLAPEILAGKPLSAQSDLYSLGSTIVRILLGRQPNQSRVDSEGKAQLVRQELTADEIQQWGEEGEEFLKVFLRSADPKPANRFQSADEVLGAIQKALPTPVVKLPKKGSTPKVNPAVASIRSLYTRSSAGAANILGLNSEFAKETYVGTRLDNALLPDIVKGNLDVVFLTGNPGDGKTSFLQQVEEALTAAGAQGESHSWGWMLELNGRKFHAIFDASESHEEMSSDELVISALSRVGEGNYTSLLAVNDGRLRQFFLENEEDFPEFSKEVDQFFKGLSTSLPRFAIVDLKMRSLAAGDEPQIASAILDTLTSATLWEGCHDCSSKPQCPSFNNAQQMAGPAREKIAKLLQISHLRRTKRATLRQIRSTLGFLITGDVSCEEVHTAVAKNEDLSSTSADLGELVFGGRSQDPLVQEWKRLDPGNLVSPAVDRLLRSEQAPKSLAGDPEEYVTFMRSHYLGLRQDPGSLASMPADESSYYRHFSEYVSILSDPGNLEHKARILKGVSKLIGAYGYSGPDLAVNQDRRHSDWAVLKPSFEGEFKLTSNEFSSPYIEFSPDLLILSHSSGAQLNISLDTAEIILGAADGNLYGDRVTDAVRFDIEGFGRKLLRQVSENLIVVEPSGSSHKVRALDGRLVRVSPAVSSGGEVS